MLAYGQELGGRETKASTSVCLCRGGPYQHTIFYLKEDLCHILEVPQNHKGAEKG